MAWFFTVVYGPFPPPPCGGGAPWYPPPGGPPTGAAGAAAGGAWKELLRAKHGILLVQKKGKNETPKLWLLNHDHNIS